MGQKCCSQNDKPDKFVITIATRVIGAVLIVLSVVEFGVGGTAFGYFTNYSTGGWWGAIASFIAGILAVISKPRGVTIAGAVISSIGILAAIAASYLDAIDFLFFSSLQTCVSSSSGTFYGVLTPQTEYQVATCLSPSSTNFDCLCTGSVATVYSCYAYNGHSNCGDILTTYPQLLSTSSGLTAALSALCFIYAILACVSACGCCVDKNDENLLSSSNSIAK